MKQLAVVLGIVLLLLGCTSRSINPGYKIIGNIQGLSNQKVLLLRYINEEWKAIDSVESKNGAFTFFGRVSIPEMYKVEISDTLPTISIFIENDEINLVGKIDSLEKYKIAGSRTHEEYERFWGKQNAYTFRIDSLEHQLVKARKKSSKVKQAKIEAQLEEAWNNQTDAIRTYVLANKTSVISAYLAWSRLANNSNLAQLQSISSGFDTSLNKLVYVELLHKYIANLKKVETGRQAIDFSMKTPDNEVVKLSKLYGKYLLIDFWASWCPPCRDENPQIVETYQRYKDKGFDILSVSLDEDHSKWLQAVKEDRLQWTQVSDLKGWNNSAGKLYAIRRIPSNVLIDPNGKIIAKNIWGKDLEEKLNDILM